jgi:type IV pilus assembly protein PilE
MKPRTNGFSIFEVLVVLVVMSILFAIAIPGYRSIVLKNGRVEARSALTALALQQERLRSACPYYARSIGTADSCGDSSEKTYVAFKQTTESNRYTLSIKTDGNYDYLLLATATGPQAGDGDCSTMSLTLDKGTQTRGPAQCW